MKTIGAPIGSWPPTSITIAKNASTRPSATSLRANSNALELTDRKSSPVRQIGSTSADLYKRKHGVDSVVVHRVLPPGLPPAPKYSLNREGLKVGTLGKIYSAKGQLVALIGAVEQAASRLVQPRLLVCGGGSSASLLRQKFGGRVEIETPGHVSEAEGIERMQACGIRYMNYGFGSFHRVLGESSFPNRLSNYARAAPPILIHVPPRMLLSDIPTGDKYVQQTTKSR
jgi:hypothetical protein